MNVAVERSGSVKTNFPVSRHRRRSNRTRAKLIEAARAIFAQKGLDRTTVDDITQRADVGRGTFYYHYADMNDLITEMIKSLLSELVLKIQTQCSGKDDLADMLDSMMTAHIEFFGSRWEDFVLFYQGRADLTLVEGFEGLDTPFVEYLNSIGSLVDDTVAQEISSKVQRRLACAIAGFISGYYSFAVISSSDDDVDKNFMMLRSAFVASLVRFIKEAISDTGNGRRREQA